MLKRKIYDEMLEWKNRSCGRSALERMENDFLARREGKVSPIEVKSAACQHHASLDKFMQFLCEK